MKASIQNIRAIIAQERSAELEEALLIDFDMVVDWIQGHDGSLRTLRLTSLLAAWRPANYFSNHFRFDIFNNSPERCLSGRVRKPQKREQGAASVPRVRPVRHRTPDPPLVRRQEQA